ncbi:DUF5666 domain-containing protein [Rhodococcus sp. IEGM 1366]|uniref:DUF5666 domain-containing protein n=1 Tax=Rhodococcus sp. IEGM 1366 TaxID=3082223 RepID=UPI0029530024|nr:DUF5666 domain-containing protein [Rhodococcus sp. IEGM 1366]MDV8069686.1 DUF5666 domain-containing protein [Rhodococcus sp. IEGM 1366]
MTDQNDPRKSDQPTEHFEIPEQYQNPQQYQNHGQQQYPYGGPDQNTEYLGQPNQQGQQGQPNPTQAFPPYNPQFDPQAPPPGATQAYPTYNAQQYGQTQQYPVAGGSGGGVPPEQPFLDSGSPDGGKRRKLGTWIAAGVVGILVAVVAIIGISLFGSSGESGTQTAFVPPTSTVAPTTPKPTTTAPAPSPTSSPLENLPGGLGDVIGQAGGAVGTVVSNDGGTLVINSIGGSQTTILTTPETTLIAFNRSSVADLQPGDNVVVDGTPVENGTMTAKTILDTSLPSFGN